MISAILVSREFCIIKNRIALIRDACRPIPSSMSFTEYNTWRKIAAEDLKYFRNKLKKH
jgi:hypothetical protein